MGVLPRAHSAVAVRCQQKGEKGSAIRVHPVLSVVKTPFPQFPPVKLPPRVQRLPRLSIPFCGAFPNQCCLILVRPPIRQYLPPPEQLKHRVLADRRRLPRRHHRPQILARHPCKLKSVFNCTSAWLSVTSSGSASVEFHQLRTLRSGSAPPRSRATGVGERSDRHAHPPSAPFH
jgi:hypothetical protein